MMTAVSAASDASDGLAGAIHAPARTIKTDAMRFRFARMGGMVRDRPRSFHSPFEPLVGHSGMWSLTSAPDVRVVTGAGGSPSRAPGVRGCPPTSTILAGHGFCEPLRAAAPTGAA